MTKYSSDFKLKIVKEYRLGYSSLKMLSKKYQLPDSVISTWITLADVQGLEGLRVQRQHREYSLDEKLTVVDYYQTHDLGLQKVAAKFNLNPSQVFAWTKIFIEHGVAGLRPKHKGRLSTMPKKKHSPKTSKP